SPGLPGGGGTVRPTTHAVSFALMYITPVNGSTAGPPHSAPPAKPGRSTVSLSTLGGTNGSPPAIVLNCFTAQECASGVRVVSMSSVTLCRVNGAGKVG